MTNAERLDAIAATQIIVDTEVAHCWELVRQGIQSQQLRLDTLDRLLVHLRAGNGMDLGQLSIQIAPPGSDRAVVRVLDDQRFCAASKLSTELERLLTRAGNATGAPSSPLLSVTPSPVESSPESHIADEPDLLGVVAGLLGTTPARLVDDPAAYRAQIERVRDATAILAAAVRDPASDEATRAAAAARLRQVLAESALTGDTTARARQADVAGTIAALGIEIDRFATALRTVTDWLEARTPAAGAAVDRLIAALDEAAGPLLGGDHATLDAERDARIRDAARAAITARLGKKPGSL